MRHSMKIAIVALGVLAATCASAQSWTLDGANSVIGFGSIKKDSAGEAHVFTGLTGGVDADGMATIEIDLGSVETNIEIRNERMIEHVFKNAPKAMLTAQIDMDDFDGLAVGDSTVAEVEGDVAFLDQDVPVYMDVFVMRVDDDTVMVTTNSMMFVSADELGINAGIDKLMELAELPSITRTSPVTFRLMFQASTEQEI